MMGRRYGYRNQMVVRRYGGIQDASGPHEQVLWVQEARNRNGCGMVSPGDGWQGMQQQMYPAIGGAGVSVEQWTYFLQTIDGHVKNYKKPGKLMQLLLRASSVIIGVIFVVFYFTDAEVLKYVFLPLIIISFGAQMWGYERTVIRPNKEVDRAIEASMSNGELLGQNVSAHYEVRFADLCKPEGAHTQRAIRLTSLVAPVTVCVQQAGIAPSGVVLQAEMVPLQAVPAGIAPSGVVLQAEMIPLQAVPARQITIEVPKGAIAGQFLAAAAPDGTQVQVAIPHGALPGTTFTATY